MKRRVRILPGTGTCPAAAGGGPPVQKPLVFARGTLGRAGCTDPAFRISSA